MMPGNRSTPSAVIPTASLRVEYWASNPRRPIAIGIISAGKMIATIELDEFKRAVDILIDLERYDRLRRASPAIKVDPEPL